MTTPDHLPGYPAPSPPAPNECTICGYGPAAAVTFRKITGMVILWRMVTFKNTWCTGCARGRFRDIQAHNLLAGWWGIISFFVNIGVLILNTVNLRKHDKIGPPQTRRPDLYTPASQPVLTPPLAKRPAPLAVGAVALLAGLGIITAGFLAEGTPSNPAAGTCFTDDGVSVYCDKSDAAWKVTSKVSSYEDCNGTDSFSNPDNAREVYCVTANTPSSGS